MSMLQIKPRRDFIQLFFTVIVIYQSFDLVSHPYYVAGYSPTIYSISYPYRAAFVCSNMYLHVQKPNAATNFFEELSNFMTT